MTTQGPPRPMQWSRLSEIYVVNGPARLYANNAIYAMIGTQPPSGTFQPNTWHTIDLKPFGVGADAKAAFLSGLLIITQGTTPCTADMQIVFRAPGDTTTDINRLMGQVTEAHAGGGQRSGFASWVPLSDGCAEMGFRLSTPAQWPQWPAYGVNLSVQMWGR
jgi:hypothetical protein